MTPRTKQSPSPALLKAVCHPIRIQALTILTERVASPKEIALALGQEVVGNVSYHVRELEKAKLVEEVDSKPRRGATEHYFRAVERPLLSTEEWERLPQEDREAFSQWIINLIVGDVGLAVTSGTFDARTDRHLSRIPLCLDAEGFRALTDLQTELVDRTLEIQAASDGRRAASKEKGMAASSVMATFLMPAIRRSKE
jgi:DNA-binding transcriptional ArsR family regulator